MTDEELAELERIAEAATEPPWETGLANDFTDRTSVEGPAFVSGNEIPDPELEPEEFREVQAQIHADATFIATARGAVPDLIAEVRRLKALTTLLGATNRKLEAAIETASGHMRSMRFEEALKELEK